MPTSAHAHQAKPHSSLPTQVVRYLAVGGASFLADFAVIIALVEGIRVHYTIATAIGFLCGLIINYQLSIRWVFSTRTMNHAGREFMLFSLIGLAGLAITELIMWAATELAAADYRAAKLLAVVTVLVWNFAVRKALLFRDQLPEST